LVVRSVMTSHFIEAVARHYKPELKETPVGFKYIAEAMEAGGFLMGGEESGGLTIDGHVPEKDGILACLLMAEKAAEIFVGAAAIGGPHFLAAPSVDRIAGRPDEHSRQRQLKIT
jgi:phosphomannomutase